MIVAFTGHRPTRLKEHLLRTEVAIRKFLEERKPDKVISGMAQGVDMFAFEHAYELGIPVIAAVPWWGHGNNWPKVHREEYIDNLDKAAEVVVVSEVEMFVPWVYQKRDEWMVDRCDLLVAVWDGVDGGGTYNTIQYAKKIGRPIEFLEWRDTRDQ